MALVCLRLLCAMLLLGGVIAHLWRKRARRFASLAELVAALQPTRAPHSSISRSPERAPAAVVALSHLWLTAPGVLTLRRARDGRFDPHAAEVLYAVRQLGIPLLLLLADARAPVPSPLPHPLEAARGELGEPRESLARIRLRTELALARRAFAPEIRRGTLRILGVVVQEDDRALHLLDDA